MIVKLLNEHHLEFLSLKGGCTSSSESTYVKYHIVGNHMSRLICNLPTGNGRDNTALLKSQQCGDHPNATALLFTFINLLGIYLRKRASKIFLLTVPRQYFFCGSFVLFNFLCHVFVLFSHLFIAALWSPAGKGLNSCL